MTTSNPDFNFEPDALPRNPDRVPSLSLSAGITEMSCQEVDSENDSRGDDSDDDSVLTPSHRGSYDEWTRIEHPNQRSQTPVSEVSGSVTSLTSSALWDPTPATSNGSEGSPTSPMVDGFRRSETSSPAPGEVGKHPSCGTTGTSWTWEDPDKSTTIASSTGTLLTPLHTHVGRSPTTSTEVGILTSSQEHLIFPILNASGLSNSDPSLEAVHDGLRDFGSHRHEEEITSETPLLGNDDLQLDATAIGSASPMRRQSFLADLADVARNRERVVSHGVGSGTLADKHDVSSSGGEVKGGRRTIDKDWLEGVARSRFPLAGADELLFESGMISLSDLGYLPLDQQAAPSTDSPNFGSPMWMDLPPGEWAVAKPENGTSNATSIEVDIPVDGSAGRRRFEQAKRLAIFALPLLAMTIWASFSPTNTLSLFENSEHTNAKGSLSTMLTSHTSIESVLLKTSINSGAVATPSTSRALTVRKESDNVETIDCDPQQSQPVLTATVQTADATQVPAVVAKEQQNQLKVKIADHPLALVQKTIATATSGFHARGRQRAATKYQFTPPGTLGVRPHATGPIVISLSASPTAVSWHPAFLHSGGFGNVSTSLFPYAAMQLATLGRELQHLATYFRYFLDGLLVRTRKVKEPFRNYFEGRDSPPKARYTTMLGANCRHPDASPRTAFGTSTKEIAEIVLERAWDELHQVFNNLELQLAGLRIRSDEAIAQAQRASRQTIKQARKGLDNVLRETADILERHTGVELPLPSSIERKKPRGPPPSSFSEKIQQLFHHAAVVLV